jgi:hypothetical protein
VIGIRFYAEYDNPSSKRRGIHNGNVVAIIPENRIPGTDKVEAIGAVYFHPDSAVAGTSTSRAYLAKYCKRIPESLAREIHPNLFLYLDANEGLK